MRIAAAGILAALAFTATTTTAVLAEAKKQPPVRRSASGTIIQPTRTIIHHANGTTTVIVVPRRSYLDVGTGVSVGDTSYRDYAFPPDGDPGRTYWFYGPDHHGIGGSPLAQPFWLP